MMKPSTYCSSPFDLFMKTRKWILISLIMKQEKHLYSKKEFFHFWSDNGIETKGYVWQNIYAHELWNGVRFDKIYYEDCAIQNKLLPKTKHVYLSGFGAYKYVQQGGDITF